MRTDMAQIMYPIAQQDFMYRCTYLKCLGEEVSGLPGIRWGAGGYCIRPPHNYWSLLFNTLNI